MSCDSKTIFRAGFEPSISRAIFEISREASDVDDALDELLLRLSASDPVQYTSMCTVRGGFTAFVEPDLAIRADLVSEGERRLLAGDRDNRSRGWNNDTIR